MSYPNPFNTVAQEEFVTAKAPVRSTIPRKPLGIKWQHILGAIFLGIGIGLSHYKFEWYGSVPVFLISVLMLYKQMRYQNGM